jgi:hypothetical protein
MAAWRGVVTEVPLVAVAAALAVVVGVALKSAAHLFWIVPALGWLVHHSTRKEAAIGADAKALTGGDDEDAEARQQRALLATRASTELTYDPTAQSLESLARFAAVKYNSQCLFSRGAKIWGSPDWDAGLSLEDNVRRSIPALKKFIYRIQVDLDKLRQLTREVDAAGGLPAVRASLVQARRERLHLGDGLDGFLYEIRGAKHGDSVEAFAVTVNRVLRTLSDADPVTEDDEPLFADKDLFRTLGPHAEVNSPSWYFSFLREPFFVTAFAPCYPTTHPRFMLFDGAPSDSCYVMLQPESAFLFRNISDLTAHTNWDDPVTERDRIRVNFLKHGRPYPIPDTIEYPTASQIVLPLDITQPTVPWWQM